MNGDANRPADPDGARDYGGGEPGSLRGILQILPGLVVIMVLAGYSFVHSLPEAEPKRAVLGAPGQARPAPASQGVLIGNKVFYPPVPEPLTLIVHFACNQDDARLARIYDPPASGTPIIMRLDQSLEEMHLLVAGKDPLFPRNTRIVTTPCVQAMIEHGEFP
jgi:hypothetical protein